MRAKYKYTLFPAILFFGIFFAGENIFAQNPPINAGATLNKKNITLGDKAIYTIHMVVPNDFETQFPQVTQENLTGFYLKDSGSKDTNLFNKKIYKRWYSIYAYASGEQTIPAATIKYRQKGSPEWQEISTKEIKIKVKSVLRGTADETNIRDIKGLKRCADKTWLFLLVILTAAAAATAFILAKRKRVTAPEPEIPAHITAYKDLEDLENQDYIRRKQFNIFYTLLSGVMRRYIEKRFNIHAPEMTTEEFLSKAKSSGALSAEHRGLLAEFLQACDLVKFARHQPGEEEAILSFSLAKKLIDQTKETVSSE